MKSERKENDPEEHPHLDPMIRIVQLEGEVDKLKFQVAEMRECLDALEEQRKNFNWCGLRDDLNNLDNKVKEILKKKKE